MMDINIKLVLFIRIIAFVSGLEYCTGELFEAVCGASQVLVLERAMYGRQRQDGECVTSEQGLDCVEDVLMQLDHKCSGRQTCQVVVGDADITLSLPCHGELFKSLDVAYSCMKVRVIPTNQRCEGPIPISIRDGTEVISSAKAPRHCDLELQTSVQYVINVTLIDFDWNAKATNDQRCAITYATLMEGEEKHKLCGGGPRRLATPYISRDNKLVLQWSMTHSSNFLIQVSALSKDAAILMGSGRSVREEDDVSANQQTEQGDSGKQINMNGTFVIAGGCVVIVVACIICIVAVACLIRERVRSKKAKSRVKSQQQTSLLNKRVSGVPGDVMQASMTSSYMHPVAEPVIACVRRLGHARTRSLASDIIVRTTGGHARTNSTATDSIVFHDMHTSVYSAYDYPDDEFSVYYDDVASDSLQRSIRGVSSVKRGPYRGPLRATAVQYRPMSQVSGQASPRVQSFTFPNMQQSVCSGYEEPSNVTEPENPLPIPQRGKKPPDRNSARLSQNFASTFTGGMQSSACSGYEEVKEEDEDEAANPLPIPKRGETMEHRMNVAFMQASVCSGYETPMDDKSLYMNRMPGDGGEASQSSTID